MSDFLMPSLGADMDEATIVEWLKSEGDVVQRGDIVAVVETVKGAIEIEIFEDGVLGALKAAVGDVIPVGAAMAEVHAADPDKPALDTGSQDKAKVASRIPTTAPTKVHTKVRVSPAALRRAVELGLEIADVPAGSDGIVGIAEVEAAKNSSKRPATQKTASKPGLDLDAMRRAIGAVMVRSKQEIPHYYVESTFDVSRFVAWLETENKKRSVAERLLYAAPLIKAIALALSTAPKLNGLFKDGEHRAVDQVHLGVATALRGGGLIAPALHDADKLTVDETMTKLRDLISRVRQGRLRGSELSDPTVTVSILGEDTADSLQPVIYHPQVAIIGCGALRVRPWVVDGSVEGRDTMTVTVAADHRVSDGRVAGRFLKNLDSILKRPEDL